MSMHNIIIAIKLCQSLFEVVFSFISDHFFKTCLKPRSAIQNDVKLLLLGDQMEDGLDFFVS